MKLKEKAIIKTESGETTVSAILATLITFVFLTVLIFSFLFFLERMSVYDDAQWCARSCVLEMESAGYLTDNLKESLKNELADLGIEESSLSFSGSTDTQADYGKPVVLKITGTIKTDAVGWRTSNVFSFFKDSIDQSITIEKAGTCKR